MTRGIHKSIFLYTLFFIIVFFNLSLAEDNIEVVPLINLDELPATFEEDKYILEDKDFEKKKSTKLVKTKKIPKKKDENIYVNLTALDKITAKTSSIKIAIGKKKNFGKLEIKPLKCVLSEESDATDTVAYIQVKDLSAKDNNQVFIFNGWTFASSPTLRSIDHPIYDLWLVDCENI
jgi:hypothetical protein